MVGRVGSGRKGSVTKAEEDLGRKRRLMLRKECSLLRYQVAQVRVVMLDFGTKGFRGVEKGHGCEDALHLIIDTADWFVLGGVGGNVDFLHIPRAALTDSSHPFLDRGCTSRQVADHLNGLESILPSRC